MYPAIWSFQLALRARGLGTTITGYHLNGHEPDVAALLGIPADVTQIALLPVAYTTTTSFRPATRSAISDITYYERRGRHGGTRVRVRDSQASLSAPTDTSAWRPGQTRRMSRYISHPRQNPKTPFRNAATSAAAVAAMPSQVTPAA